MNELMNAWPPFGKLKEIQNLLNTKFLTYLLTPKHEITAFSLSEMLGETCSQKDCYLVFRSSMFGKKNAKKKVSNIPQPSQSLLHKAEGILVFFFPLISFAM